jgi:hypothetical protein
MNQYRIEHKILALSPRHLVGVFDNNTPVHAKTIIEKHFAGSWIKVSGIVESVDLMSNYVTLNFYDNDHILIGANFSKPVSAELSLYKKGSVISLLGQIYNVSGGIVVLDNCKISNEIDKLDDTVERKNVVTKIKWWEKTWVQIIMLLGALSGIIGLISLFK